MRARACGARTAGSIRTRPCGRCCSLYPPSQTPATHTPTRNTRIHAPHHCYHAHTRPHRLIDGSTVGHSLRTAWMRFGATPQFPRRPLAHARALAHCRTHCVRTHPPGRPRASAHMHHSLRCTRDGHVQVANGDDPVMVSADYFKAKAAPCPRTPGAPAYTRARCQARTHAYAHTNTCAGCPALAVGTARAMCRLN
jgi:hypothetical protein